MLKSDEWCHLGALWDESTCSELNLAWHQLKGWPDMTQGLLALKKQVIITALSNGNICLLIDMAQHSDLPTEIPKHTCKPSPSQCTMVASPHPRPASCHKPWYETIYVRRSGEDPIVGDGALVKSKDEGGEVDCMVDSFVDLAERLKTA